MRTQCLASIRGDRPNGLRWRNYYHRINLWSCGTLRRARLEDRPISFQAGEELKSSETSTPTKAQTTVKPIETDEMRTEKKEDSLCLRYATLTEDDNTHFQLYPNCLLVRKSPRDGATKIVVPESLQPRILYLVHYPLLEGLPRVQNVRKSPSHTLLALHGSRCIYSRQELPRMRSSPRDKIQESKAPPPFRSFCPSRLRRNGYSGTLQNHRPRVQ